MEKNNNEESFQKTKEEILQEKRKKALNKKLANAGIWFLVGAAAVLIAATPVEILQSLSLNETQIELVQAVGGLLGFGEIVGICKFAKAVHDPVLPEDVEILKEKDKKFIENQQRDYAEAAAKYEARKAQKEEEKKGGFSR